MRPIFSGAIVLFLFSVDIASGMAPLGFRPARATTVAEPDFDCYKNKDFAESITLRMYKRDEEDFEHKRQVGDELLNLIHLATHLGNTRRVCSTLGSIMSAVEAEYRRLYCLTGFYGVPVTSPFEEPDISRVEFQGKITAYVAAVSGGESKPPGGAVTDKGTGKIRSLLMIAYAFSRKRDALRPLISTWLTPTQLQLGETMKAFSENLLSAIVNSDGRRVSHSPPPTPSFEDGAFKRFFGSSSTLATGSSGSASDDGFLLGSPASVRSPKSPAEKPVYNPEFKDWYEQMFGIYNVLVTWEDEDLIRAYIAVLNALSNPGLMDRSSVYRVLTYVNKQLYVDRVLAMDKAKPELAASRVAMYKRILRRISDPFNPFVATFEQIEMMDLYDQFLGSEQYHDSRNFAYKDSVARGLMLDGVLFSIEVPNAGIESAKDLAIEPVYSLYREAIDEYFIAEPNSASPAVERNEDLFAMHQLIAELRLGLSATGAWSISPRARSAIEAKMMGLVAAGKLVTPVDFGVKFLTPEYCGRIAEVHRRVHCEQVARLMLQLANNDGEILNSPKIVSLLPSLLKLSKILVRGITDPSVLADWINFDEILVGAETVVGSIATGVAASERKAWKDELFLLDAIIKHFDRDDFLYVAAPKSSKSKKEKKDKHHGAARKKGKKGHKSGARSSRADSGVSADDEAGDS